MTEAFGKNEREVAAKPLREVTRNPAVKPMFQRPVDGGLKRAAFELAPGEGSKGRYQMAWGRVIGRFDEQVKLAAIHILSTVLCGNNQSPLNKFMLSQGLAEDVKMTVQDGVAQPWVRLELKNLDEAVCEKAGAALFEKLEQLAVEGLDHRQLEAAMVNLEFQMRERDYGTYPQGLGLGLSVLDSWLYGGAPEAFLEVGDLFEVLRKKMAEGYFEQLIRDVLLNNGHKCQVILEPSHKIGEMERQQEKQRLFNELSAWSAAQRQLLMERQKQLEIWQSQQDSREALASLPHLRISDIPVLPEITPTETDMHFEVPVLKHSVAGNGIVYVTLYFEITGCNEDDLSALSFLCRLFGRLKTSVYSEEELMNRIHMYCGQLNFYINTYSGELTETPAKICLCAAFGAMESNVGEALTLAAEILTATCFVDEAGVLDILRQNKMQSFQQIVMSGTSVALGRVAAQTSAAGVAQECSGGYTYYRWLKEKENGWKWEQIQNQLERLKSQVICKRNLTISITGDWKKISGNILERFLIRLPESNSELKQDLRIRPSGIRSEGIVIPADISFTARGTTSGY